MATNDAPLTVAASRGLSLALGQAPSGAYVPFGQPGGTVDTAFNIDNFVYQGAFKYQLNDAVSGTGYNRGAFGYRAPDGSNGASGSFFADSIYGNAVAEFQIPASFSMATDRASLPSASVLQGFVNVKPKATTPETDPNNAIGWMHMIDGKLWISMHYLYGAGSDPKPMIILNDPLNLDSSTAYGFFGIDGGAGLTLNYCSELPAAYQTTFGATHLVGNCFGMSIASRSSQGPSLLTFDKAAHTGSQTNIPTTMEMGWPYSSNRAMGDTLYPAPAGEFYADNAWDSYNEAVSLHYYRDQLGFTTFEEWRTSNPRTEWDTLPRPSESVRNDLNSLINGGWIGFIVPGTDTFLVIGYQTGNEFGNGYKQNNFQGTLPSNGGGNALDQFDQDYYYWAFNMNDIVSAANIYDLLPFEYGRFDDNRWFNKGGNILTVGDKPGGGHFDPATNRLYVSIPSGNEEPNIVAVYQLGGS